MSYSYVNFAQGSAGSGVTDCFSGTFSNTAGNLLVGLVWAGGSATTITMSDGAANTYQQAAQWVDSTDSAFAQLFYSWNIITDATNSVHAHFAAAVNNPQVVVAQYSGLYSASDPFVFAGSTYAQQKVSSPGTGANTILSGAATPTKVPCMSFGITVSASGGVPGLSAGTGWTGRSLVISNFGYFEDMLLNSGSSNASFGNTGGGTNVYGAFVINFAMPGASAPVIPPVGTMQTYAMR